MRRVLAGEDEGDVGVPADRGIDPVAARRRDALVERADRMPSGSRGRSARFAPSRRRTRAARLPVARARSAARSTGRAARSPPRLRRRRPGSCPARRRSPEATRAAAAQACPTRRGHRSGGGTEGSGKRSGEHGRDRGSARRPRHPALDPRQQRDQEERGDVEEVALLDARRERRCERADFEQQPGGQRQRRGEKDAEWPVERPADEREQQRAPQTGRCRDRGRARRRGRAPTSAPGRAGRSHAP